MNVYQISQRSALAVLLATGLSACGNDDNSVSHELAELSYSVTVYNDTAAQPLSPLLVGLHDDSLSLWRLGLPASVALENMAESGAHADLLDLFGDDHVAVSGAGVLMPGEYEELTLTIKQDKGWLLSATSMLVNTNDAFAGLNAMDISGLSVGDSRRYSLAAYDAGSEANSEMAGSIPGPADGGEGFNQIRDDIMNKVSRHPGLVTQADDLDSVLSPDHRIAGQVGRLVITRIN